MCLDRMLPMWLFGQVFPRDDKEEYKQRLQGYLSDDPLQAVSQLDYLLELVTSRKIIPKGTPARDLKGLVKLMRSENIKKAERKLYKLKHRIPLYVDIRDLSKELFDLKKETGVKDTKLWDQYEKNFKLADRAEKAISWLEKGIEG